MIDILSYEWHISFDEKGRKQAVALGAVAVFVPYIDHVEAKIMAYGTAALLRLHIFIFNVCIGRHQ